MAVIAAHMGRLGVTARVRPMGGANHQSHTTSVELREALIEARRLCNGQGPIIRSERGRAMTPMSIVVWFNRVYGALGLEGCSSHSGRRTFITRAARVGALSGGLTSRSSIARRSPVDPDHATVHRWRQRRPAEVGISDLKSIPARKLRTPATGLTFLDDVRTDVEEAGILRAVATRNPQDFRLASEHFQLPGYLRSGRSRLYSKTW